NPELFRRLKLRLGHLLGVGAPEPGAPAAAYGWFSPPRVNERLVALEKRIGDDRRRGLQAEGSDTGQDSGLAALQHYHLARYLYLQNVLLDKTAYGTSRWSPAMSAVARAELAGQPVRPADERWRVPREVRAARELRMEKGGSHVVDADNGMLLATVWLRELAEPATRLAVEAFVEQPPPLAPPGVAAGQCLERTWLVTSQTPGGRLVGDFRFEYLDEHSLHNELGAKVDDEGQLRLWLLDADGLWRPLPTVVDARANTLTTKALPLEPLRLYRLVACQSNAAPAAPGRAQ
ncbi:MAG: hypothetical protein OEV73_13095, partial [Desulfobulbaceae bacterium]|nr:hypothetical protein [Desulfobulbaceae bacterium]